jgi:hypothetical protein
MPSDPYLRPIFALPKSVGLFTDYPNVQWSTSTEEEVQPDYEATKNVVDCDPSVGTGYNNAKSDATNIRPCCMF